MTSGSSVPEPEVVVGPGLAVDRARPRDPPCDGRLDRRVRDAELRVANNAARQRSEGGKASVGRVRHRCSFGATESRTNEPSGGPVLRGITDPGGGITIPGRG